MKKLIAITFSIFVYLNIQAQGLEVNQGTDVNNNDEKNGYAIIGDEAGANITIDANELQTKNTNNPAGTLFINDRAGQVSISGSSSAGNVTIGGYNGASKLTVKVQGSNGIGLTGDNTGSVGYNINNGGGNHYLLDDNADDNTLKLESANETAFNTNGANEAMRIKSDGDVYIGQNLIGGNQPQVHIYSDDNNIGLEVHNDDGTGSNIGLTAFANASGADNRTGIYGIANGPSTGALMIGVHGLGNTITASNAYGVYGEVVGNSNGINRYGVYGTAPSNTGESWALYGNGDIYYTGAFSAPSDARLKKNVQPLEGNILDKVMQVQVKTYLYDKAAYPYINLAEGTQTGFIAQELQTLFPNLVSSQHHSFVVNEDPNNPLTEKTIIEENLLGVKYIEMIPILTKAIQQQQVQIELLKAEIEVLKTK